MTRALDPGWIPHTPLAWLEALREAHERLLAELRAHNRRVHAVRQQHLDDDTAYQAALVKAAREGRDKPARPESHDPQWRAAQIAAAEEGRLELQQRVAKFIAGALEVMLSGEDELRDMEARPRKQTPTGMTAAQRREWEKPAMPVGVLLRQLNAPENTLNAVADQLGVPCTRAPLNITHAAVVALAPSINTNQSRLSVAA